MTDYYSLPGISATALKAGSKSMLAMHWRMTGDGPADTPAMRMGRLIHKCILEPDLFCTDVVVWEGAKRGKAWTEFKSEHEGRDIVTQEEHKDLLLLSNRVHANPTAHRLIEQTEHERVLTWTDEVYGDAKARLDGIANNALPDIKSTSIIEPRRFMAHAYRMGYLLQLGWYRHGARQNGYAVDDAWIVAAQQKDEQDVAVYHISGKLLDDAYDEARKLAVEYRCCQASGSFPGVAAEVVEFQVPAWATAGESVELQIGGETMEV